MKTIHRLIFSSFLILLSTLVSSTAISKNYDLTLVGPARWQDGLGRISIGLAQTLKDDLSINYIESCFWDETDLPSDLKSIFSGKDTTPGRVALLTSPLSGRVRTHANDIPDESSIKIAYSMFESDKIHDKWVTVLNEKFDLVVVPDAYCEEVYKNCGVFKPIITLPHGIYLEQFLQSKPYKKSNNERFTFGLTGTFCERKNQALVLEAFCQEFKNDPHVFLKMHGRSGGSTDYYAFLINICKNQDIKNVEIFKENFTDSACISFFQSLDCYILLSRGEGLSLTPREALALEIPCILSNNTAHRTICQTGYVYAVPSGKKVLADYGGIFPIGEVGYNFDCEIADVRKALRTVYDNYALYKQKARDSQKWLETYLWKNLRLKFLNLIKPKKIILGSKNEVTDDYFMTNSSELYHKYQSVLTLLPTEHLSQIFITLPAKHFS